MKRWLVMARKRADHLEHSTTAVFFDFHGNAQGRGFAIRRTRQHSGDHSDVGTRHRGSGNKLRQSFLHVQPEKGRELPHGHTGSAIAGSRNSGIQQGYGLLAHCGTPAFRQGPRHESLY